MHIFIYTFAMQDRKEKSKLLFYFYFTLQNRSLCYYFDNFSCIARRKAITNSSPAITLWMTR